MLILLHVILALSALAVAIAASFSPADNKLKASYGLAFGTLSSGVLLIVVNHASVLRTCMTGIFFFAVVTVLNETTRRKLAVEEN